MIRWIVLPAICSPRDAKNLNESWRNWDGCFLNVVGVFFTMFIGFWWYALAKSELLNNWSSWSANNEIYASCWRTSEWRFVIWLSARFFPQGLHSQGLFGTTCSGDAYEFFDDRMIPNHYSSSKDDFMIGSSPRQSFRGVPKVGWLETAMRQLILWVHRVLKSASREVDKCCSIIFLRAALHRSRETTHTGLLLGGLVNCYVLIRILWRCLLSWVLFECVC